MSVFALVAASDFNADDFLSRYGKGLFDCVVAVDGGFAHLQKVGVAPDVVLGDFDSLGFVPDHGCVVEHPVQKDQSDLELALDLAVGKGASAVWAYGVLGGRVDHTIAALHSLAAVSEQGIAVSAVAPGVVSEPGCADGVALHFLVGPARLDIDVPQGGSSADLRGVVSVHAACDKAEGVTERGLFYPLEDATVTNRTSWGLSNELAGKPCSVEVAKGTLYVFCPAACSVRRAILCR